MSFFPGLSSSVNNVMVDVQKVYSSVLGAGAGALVNVQTNNITGDKMATVEEAEGLFLWKLETGTDATDVVGGVARPADYTDASPKVWRRQTTTAALGNATGLTSGEVPLDRLSNAIQRSANTIAKAGSLHDAIANITYLTVSNGEVIFLTGSHAYGDNIDFYFGAGTAGNLRGALGLTSAASGNAAGLTSGELPDQRLSSNVVKIVGGSLNTIATTAFRDSNNAFAISFDNTSRDLWGLNLKQLSYANGVSIGGLALTPGYGNLAQSNGNFVTAGDSQAVRAFLRTNEDGFFTSNAGVLSGENAFIIPTHSCVTINARWSIIDVLGDGSMQRWGGGEHVIIATRGSTTTVIIRSDTAVAFSGEAGWGDIIITAGSFGDIAFQIDDPISEIGTLLLDAVITRQLPV